MGHHFRSSGDLAADRRFDWARGCAEARDFAAAADLYAQALDLAPDWPPALAGLAAALVELGRTDEAAAAYERLEALDPADIHGASLALAALGRAPAPRHAPAAYVRGLFDGYADRFDRALVDGLGYRVPELIASAIEAAAPGRRFARALDLGCGTGLMGERLRQRSATLVGVDLSAAMVVKARRRGIYDRIVVGDVLAGLADVLGPDSGGTPEAAAVDLVTAADVFVYVGRLEAVFAAVSDVLAPGGLFVFSAERAEEGDVVLRDSLRYAHSDPYLRGLADRHALDVLSVDRVALRRDRGTDVEGSVVALGK